VNEHIAYAMRNVEATNAFIWFNAPSALKDWSFLAIEAIIWVGTICAALHAIRHGRQQGNNSALLTLGGCFTYGLLMDISSYYTVENFWHGEFSVMFLYNRLPLYIALLYPALIYHIVMTVRRYEFPPLVEAITVAFYGELTYLIFDNLGPILGWWIWDTSDPTTFPYLNAVPLTSYHWFFAFTGAFALASRKICWDWVAEGKDSATVAAGFVALPFLTVLLGVIAFVPYNFLAANVSHAVAAAYFGVIFALAGSVFLFNFRRPSEPRDKLLMIFPLTYSVGLIYIHIAKFHLFFAVDANGLSAEGLAAGNPLAVVLATVASTAILLAAHPIETGR
jgi:hypothetical protein